MIDQHKNRLAHEKSPYLLQHAHNPVDWYPWGKEAFSKARRENKPIFLSIGYSTCHWCHVMERESFEKEESAKILNAYYVSIKVDREERPDVDAVYMTALQAMTGSGGWPMSLFLTPDLQPFFAGTYFPPIPAHGRPSFTQLLDRVRELWNDNRDALIESGEHIVEALKASDKSTAEPNSLSDATLRDSIEKCYRYFEQAFDREEGGFGPAPKFPRPVQFDFLFQYYAAFPLPDTKPIMPLRTLEKMAAGGIHDHLGGGFHRYSVDRYWRVSHFEKMLYDQAQLVHSYLDAWQLTHNKEFANTVENICEYVRRDLMHDEGAFFCAEDADSDGEEGKFYVWTYQEIEDLLGENAPVFSRYYGITKEGNFEYGKNVLHISSTMAETADEFHISIEQLPDILAEGRSRLLHARNIRVRPSLDDKVLTSWNGLMIGAMARAADLLRKPQYLDDAWNAGEFIWKRLRPEGRLLHRWRDGEARFDASLDDYAFLIQGYLDLYEASFEAQWLRRAIELQAEQDSVLYDTEYGGYFDAREASDLILRSKNEYDGAEPSGNSVSVRNLYRLAVFAEEEGFRKKVDEVLAYFLRRIRNHPFAMPAMMAAALCKLKGMAQAVFAGGDIRELKHIVNATYQPWLAKLHSRSAVGEFARSLHTEDSLPTVFICRNFVCELPINDPAELKRVLTQGTNGARSTL